MGNRQIIFVNRFFYPDHSATAQILDDLAFHLAEGNRRILVITSNGLYDDPSAKLPSRELIRGVEIHRVYQPRFDRANLIGRAIDYLFMYFHFAQAILRLVKVRDLVIVKTDPPLLSLVLLPVVHWKQAKIVNWLQDLYPEVAVQFGMRTISAVSPILEPLRDLSLRGADHNIVIGDIMRERLGRAGVSDERVSVIPNWSDDERINRIESDTNPLRQEWGLRAKFVVAYSGNLGRAHEYQTILDAADRLKDEKDLVFLFIGGGVLTPKLKADICVKNLEHLFEFQPYQPVDKLTLSLTAPDVHWVSLLPKMEGLIVPSKFYGNCAAGKPTIFIGDPDGEIARIIETNDCGVAVQVGDGEKLAQTIRQLKREPARLNRMGKNARRTLEREFSRARALESWERLTARI
jgi:colanic acid biosynthesis glycosyl transferase WcaI